MSRVMNDNYNSRPTTSRIPDPISSDPLVNDN
jgi:hypothetical protein